MQIEELKYKNRKLKAQSDGSDKSAEKSLDNLLNQDDVFDDM